MTCFFLPPYLLQHLAEVDDGAADPPRRSLVLDQRLRRSREQQTAFPRPPAAADAGRRLIHTANNTETLPGEVVRREGDADTGDAATDEAYAASGEVWDLYAEAFGRQSFDGKGSTISVTVHYGSQYDNAFWDGQQLVFGDGDGQIFDRFTKPMDVLCHEFSHGFVQYTTGFTYQGQSGALNESIADVFASMAKQRSLSQAVTEADWLIGEGLFLPGVKAKALRSMIEPGTAYDDGRLGKDPQVGSMADYVDTTDDNGGVHINSGIPNRAFALAANAVGGNSWERAGKVWFDAMTSGEVGSDADFASFARATFASAQRVFADDAQVAQQVSQAWASVGIDVAATPAPTTSDPTPAPADQTQPLPVPTPEPEQPRRVEVRRSGGFTGGVRAGAVDLDDDPDGPELRSLLNQVDLRDLGSGSGGADRFVYTLSYGDLEVSVPEHELPAPLSRVVQIVLSRPDLDLG